MKPELLELMSLAIDFEFMPLGVEPASNAQVRSIIMALKSAIGKNITRDERMRLLNTMTGNAPVLHSGVNLERIESTNDLTKTAASVIISWSKVDGENATRPEAAAAIRYLADGGSMPEVPCMVLPPGANNK
jgi:hypothetical protein